MSNFLPIIRKKPILFSFKLREKKLENKNSEESQGKWKQKTVVNTDIL